MTWGETADDAMRVDHLGAGVGSTGMAGSRRTLRAAVAT